MVDTDVALDASLRRGPRGPRPGVDATGVNRTASCLMSQDDPSMLLLRRDIQDHARTRRKSVTMSSMPDDERAELEDCWKALEIDGSVDVKQLIKAADLVFGVGSYSERNVRRAFGVLDVMHSGQVDWITFRAFMTANWNAGRNADDALWTENRKRGDDMLIVDGSMRLVDLIKAYRRRTLVERALKDAQGQLREMQHKRDAGGDADGDSLTPSSASQAPAPAAPRTRRRSISYDPDDVASRLPTSGGAPTSRRQQAQPGAAAPSRLRRAQAEVLAAAGIETAMERDWSQAEYQDDSEALPSPSSAAEAPGRLLPPIVTSSPTSPVDHSNSPLSRFSRPLASPLNTAPTPMTSSGNHPSSAPSSHHPPGKSPSQLHLMSSSQPQFSSAPQAGTRNGNRMDAVDVVDPRLPAQKVQSEQAQQPSMIGQTPSGQQQHHEPSYDSRHNGQSNGQSNSDKRGSHAKGAPKNGAAHSGILAPIKQDISSGFGRLAKFFWKSAPAEHHAAAVSVAPDSHRSRLPRI